MCSIVCKQPVCSPMGTTRGVNPTFSSLIEIAKTLRGSHLCKHKEPFQEIALPLVLTDVRGQLGERLLFQNSQYVSQEIFP